MDSAIDLSDASKALDLSNIRFQLMQASPTYPQATKADNKQDGWKTPSPST